MTHTCLLGRDSDFTKWDNNTLHNSLEKFLMKGCNN
jgi:hypothetical protein